jgi:dihydroxyacetone kinase-like protein
MSDAQTTPRSVIEAVAQAIEANASHLSELDAAGGDGDHGVSLVTAARAVLAALDAEMPADYGALLNRIATSIITAVGAAMGPLYGTALMRAGKTVAGQTNIDAPIVASMLEAAVEGIKTRGKAQVGDKTMLDALVPAAIAARSAADSGQDVAATLNAAADAAERGAQATRDMVARKGRASRLGDRTLGYQDAGATSTALILRTLALQIDSKGSQTSAEFAI